MTRNLKLLGLAAIAALALTALAAAPASAAFGLKDFKVTFSDEEGAVQTQAGSHPFAMSTNFNVNTREESGKTFIEGATKDTFITPPIGLAGNPTATPRCSGPEFADIDTSTSFPACANETAIGYVAARVAEEPGLLPQELVVPLYNLDPAPGAALKLGLVVSNIPVTVEAGLSETRPYRILAPTINVTQVLPFFGAEVTLWGNPAEEAHDPFRGDCLENTNPVHKVPGEPLSKGKCPVSIAEKPFLTLPRTCEGPLTTTYAADEWLDPGARLANGEPDLTDPAWVTGQGQSDAMTGCGKVEAGFNPQVATTPTSTSAESPSGLDVELTVIDKGLSSPTGTAKSDIKKAVIAFPPGITVNPSQAEGLGACSEADLARESADSLPGEGCPENSKIGSLEVTTPLLENTTLKGSIYIATPFQNPTGGLIALYLVFRDRDLGVLVSQPVAVAADPLTGQLTGTSDELPQLPISSVKLHFRSGARSPLVMPPTCGTYTSTAQFTPWVNPAAPYVTTSSFTVTSGPGGGPCPNPAAAPPFAPRLSAGTISNAAGHYSPFYMRITRSDGEGEITRLSAVLPKGLVGKLAGIPACPQGQVEAAKSKSGLAERAAPSCPLASRLGSTIGGAGVGPELTYVGGSVYLGGPYKGAPLSAVAIVPAVAGPFDVGTVVVQVGLNLNPVSGEVEIAGAASDPIPRILQGIPLKLRDLRISIDRPEFILNPTSCEEQTTRATIAGSGQNPLISTDDVNALASDRFQASSCASLGFKPKFQISLKGATKRAGHPTLRTVLTPRADDANLDSAVVILPHSQFIDPERISNPCTRVQFNENACPPDSILGHARAFTPLLDEPLEGNVYFRANGGEREIPDIVVDLKGLFRVTATGFVDSINPRAARIRTTFENLPDAPTSKIVITLKGGKEGVIQNSANLCAKPREASIRYLAQNGRRYNVSPVIQTSCKKKKKAQGSGKRLR